MRKRDDEWVENGKTETSEPPPLFDDESPLEKEPQKHLEQSVGDRRRLAEMFETRIQNKLQRERTELEESSDSSVPTDGIRVFHRNIASKNEPDKKAFQAKQRSRASDSRLFSESRKDFDPFSEGSSWQPDDKVSQAEEELADSGRDKENANQNYFDAKLSGAPKPEHGSIEWALETLGIGREEFLTSKMGEEDLVRLFRSRSHIYHPDKYAAESEQKQQWARNQMRLLNEAREIVFNIIREEDG